MDKSELIKLNNATVTNETAGLKSNKPSAVDVDNPDIRVKGPKEVIVAKNHATLENLDYEHSGHKGFASEKDLNTQIKVYESLQVLPQEAVQALKRNSTIQLLFHDNLYSLSVRAGKLWTYTYIEQTTGNIHTITVDMDSGAFDISSSNPVQRNLDSHINDTSVHLQTGERIAWNNKVSATVDETEEKLIFSSEV